MSKREKICCIYKLTNKINGKIYIGQTVDYHRRMNEYKNRKSSKEKSSKYGIMEEVEKYGFENFTSEIIRECSRDELTYYEMFYIDKFKSYLKKYGYNSFHKKSNEDKNQCMNIITKRKMSKAHIGLTESADTKRKKSNKIIAIKDDELIYCDSAKLFGDYVGSTKDYIKNCLRQPTTVKGYLLFYDDPKKREEMREKMLNKRSIRNKRYMELLDYLDNSSVETIERDFNVKVVTYESLVE